jgi:site-specific recombinase XerD
MEIKRIFGVFLQKVKGREEERIRFRIVWEGKRLQVNTGHSIPPRKWDSSTGRVKKNGSNAKRESSLAINKTIQLFFDTADSLFKRYEVEGVSPTAERLSEDFSEALGRSKAKAEGTHGFSVWEAYTRFIVEESAKKSWSDATLAKHRSLQRLLHDYCGELAVSSFDAAQMRGYTDFMLERGMKNTSIKRNLSFVGTFLRFCDEKEYLHTDWSTYSPELKTVHRAQVVFLTLDEVRKVYAFEFPSTAQYLARARDILCFQCFTGLRFSDVAKLRKTDVRGDAITVVTKKTDTAITIELNDYSRAILAKYQDVALPDGLALPVVSNQRENEYVKAVCALAGIDEPTTKVFFVGGRRLEETKPKYELVGTHTGRRSFICNALSMGISAETVMKWTGHTDYKALQPYVDVSNEAKRKNMALFNIK